MSSRRLVCPHEPALIGRLRGREIAVRVNSPSEVPGASQTVRASGNSLVCVVLDSVKPLDKIPFEDEWKGIPLAVMAPSAGRFRDLVPKLPLLRELNLRVFLPATNENIRDARILASSGVHCAVDLEKTGIETDWEALSDLMTYALFGRVPHAAIEPFDHIARIYKPALNLRWGPVFFDDPEQFLHLDKKGNAALSRAELLTQKFAGRIEDVDNVPIPEAEKRTGAWRDIFMTNGVCAACQGFKLCLGRFAPGNGKEAGCSAFFSEMLESLEELRLMKENSPADMKVWQL